MTPHPPAPALSAEEARTIARFDAAETPPEVVAAGERVEAVARAITDALDSDDPNDWMPPALAAAAIAADPSPAEEAVRRVLHDMYERAASYSELAEDAILAWVDDLRAALASPAPAPQGEEGQR